MNVEQLTSPQEEAEKKLRAYRRHRLRKDARELYQATEVVYEPLARGAKVIDAHQAIREAPRDAKGRPLLAIARADREQVEVQIGLWPDRDVVRFYAGRFGRRRQRLQSSTASLNVRVEQFHSDHWHEGYARVPMVPADVRPETGQLRNWFILWEVDQWHDRPVNEPPGDPYLLKHLIGPFYEVLAEWELTEVERAVMRFVL